MKQCFGSSGWFSFEIHENTKQPSPNVLQDEGIETCSTPLKAKAPGPIEVTEEGKSREESDEQRKKSSSFTSL